MNKNLAILETDGSNTIVNFLENVASQIPDHVWRTRGPRARVYLLTKRRFAILTLSAVDEGRRFGVKTVQTLGLLIHICVVLRDELPPDFRGNNTAVD